MTYWRNGVLVGAQPAGNVSSSHVPEKKPKMLVPQPMPIIIPADLFDPTPANPSNPPAMDVAAWRAKTSFAAMVDCQRKGARSGDDWNGPGEHEHRPKEHDVMPDDWQAVYRYLKDRDGEDRVLLEAEARCTINKGDQLEFLDDLREAEMKKPAAQRQHFLTAAEVRADFQAQREEAKYRLIAREASSAAVAFLRWPPEPPTPSPPPPPCPPCLPSPPSRSIWSTVAGAVTSLLRRKRCHDDDIPKPTRPAADGSEERPAKRARVEHVREPQPSFRHLRHQHIAPLPEKRKRRGTRETHPAVFACKGVAAFPVHYSTSDVAMQTDPTPDIPSPVAASSRQPAKAPPSRTLSLTDADAAGPSRQPSDMPATRRPCLKNAGVGTAGSSTASAVGPIRTAKKEKGPVRFAMYDSHARPPRVTSPPPPHVVGEDPVPEMRKGKLVWPKDLLGAEYKRRFGNGTASGDKPANGKSSTVVSAVDAMLPPADSAVSAADPAVPTLRHVWTNPNASYVTYQDVAVQYEVPSPDAASGQKTRRGKRAGKDVQRRRARKEAATTTAPGGEAGAKVDSAA
ncbi:hypothetical protein AURDEDRAFT_154643 [Auricularia subglabra TFB-10046 SS5]|uniref:Uncharacterized protein n=1 Tax=Auricularia subglabra (strain TFB-10046 / SS5) TaxID=717982 RepID=J0WSN1_AURST|nr:hypothetical protein AURDEDRAFT_154643 [Auricularia subglabra TFB-10046 SS5]